MHQAPAGLQYDIARDGRFYVTWPDNPDATSFDPIQQHDGSMTFSDREPYHYSFAVLASLAATIGAHAERVDDDSHPRRESVMVVTRD